jgi:predicted site-specific integrase-resolvase
MSQPVPQLLTLIAVARALCVSPHTIRSWVRKGRLRPLRLCRRLLFHPDEITRALAEARDTHHLAEVTPRSTACQENLTPATRRG